MKSLTIFLFLFSIQLYSQSYLNIHYTDDSYRYAPLLEIQKIFFNAGGDQLIIEYNGIPPTIDDLSTIGEITFNSEYPLGWTVYNTTNSGLPDNYVHRIAIEGNGNKWLLTAGSNSQGDPQASLVKIDGTDWTVYDLYNSGIIYNNHHITSLAIDGDGNKWIGSWSGLEKFDGTNWTVYTYDNSEIPDDHINCLAIDGNDNIWIGGANGGLAKFDGTSWTSYNTSNSGIPSNDINYIAIDSNGNKWIGASYHMLVMFDGINWTVYDHTNSGLPDSRVWSIAIDGNGNKWIGTASGLVKFDGTDWTVYNTTNSGLPHNNISSLAIAGNDNIWIGTSGGLAVYSAGGPCMYEDLILTSQADIDAFIYTEVLGDLIIEGADITNVDGLLDLIYVEGDLYIINNPLLTNLDGLSVSSLTSVGGNLSITSNASLTNLDGLSSLTYVGGDLSLTDNILLTSFSGLYPLLDADGVAGNITIVGNGTNPDVVEILIGGLIGRIEQLVNTGVLNQGQGNALTTKLNGALQKLAQGKTNAAINKLNAFINQVNGFINAGVLTPEQGQPLITAVNDIIDLINNGLAKQGNDGTSPEIPTEFTLLQNYPNPFNPTTTLIYGLPEDSPVVIKIYDVLGAEIMKFTEEHKAAGYHKVIFNASNLPSGIYFYRIQAGDYIETKKMILMK